MTMGTTTPNTQGLEGLSLEELRQELDRREKAEASEKEKALRAYEVDKDNFIRATAIKMETISKDLRELKTNAVQRANDLLQRSYEVHGRKRKDKPVDQFTIISQDGQYKVVMDRQFKGSYNEHADVAIAEIKDILREKFEGRNKVMYDILDSILLKNSKGDYDERLVAKLRKHEAKVNDPRFSSALDTLSKAYVPGESATYIRAYSLTETGKWADINVTFSSM